MQQISKGQKETLQLTVLGVSLSDKLAGHSSIWQAIPETTECFANAWFELLSVPADLHLSVLVPRVQQVPGSLEWQVAPVPPLDKVAAPA